MSQQARIETQSRSSRPAGERKWKATERAIRRQIVDGTWAPDGKLPTYDELETGYSLSRIMLQQVMRRLKQDGFVIGRERQGLFVNPANPFRNRLALLLPREVNELRFWRGLDKAARAACQAAGKNLEVYAGMENSPAENARLLEDAARYMVCGLVVPMTPAPQLAPALADARIPCAVFGGAGDAANHLMVKMDNRQLAAKGIALLAARGCRKIAYIGNQDDGNGMATAFAAEIAHGGPACPGWQRFSIWLENLEVVEKIVYLLLSLPPAERPDGIFIGDDNLVAAVVRGVVGKGVRVPGELQIVSHCNWPIDDLAFLPVDYIGFDLPGMLAEIIHRFTVYHEGGGLGGALTVPALTAEESAARPPA